MTLTVSQARELTRGTAVLLVEIALKNSGPTLYFSDRCLDVGAQRYEDYLLDLSGLRDEVKRLDSSALNTDITLLFKNDPIRDVTHLVLLGDTYPFVGSTVTIKEVFDDATLGQTTPATLFVGMLDEPQRITLMEFECQVSSRAHYLGKIFEQNVVNLTDFPDALDDIGEPLPLLFGGPMIVPTLKTDWGAVTDLAASLTAAATSMIVGDTTDFPSSGYVYVDEEIIQYSGKTGTTFTGLTRGYSTTDPSAHGTGATVIQHPGATYSLISDSEIHSISSTWGLFGGALRRNPTNATLSVASGRSRAYLAARHRVHPVDDSIAVSDTIGVSDTITPTISGAQAVTPNAIQQNACLFQTSDPIGTTTKTLTWSAAPAGTLTGVTIRYFFRIWVQTAPTMGNYVQLNVNGTQFANVTWATIETTGATPVAGTTDCFYRDVSYGSAWQTSATVTKVRTGGLVEYQLYGATQRATIAAPTVGRTGNASKTGAATKAGEVVNSELAERVYVNATGTISPHADYGTVGTAITRPDHVIKWWLRVRMGFSASEIDDGVGGSFTDSGTWYASNSYTLQGLLSDARDPYVVLFEMAHNCRSVVNYRAGKWYLNVIPDTAPAATKRINSADLVGQGAMFVFGSTPSIDLANALTINYARNYGPDSGEKPWKGVRKAEDVELDMDRIPATLDLPWVRGATQADGIGALELLKRKRVLKTVEFPVFWEHADAYVGQTVDIENALWTGMKFFLETAERIDAHRARILGVEWWV